MNTKHFAFATLREPRFLLRFIANTLFGIILLCPFLYAQLSLDISDRPATATQAVVSYTAPDSRSCRLQVSESPTFATVVPDVDPALFPDSDYDMDRPTTVNVAPERRRTVVIGLRAAETAVDGKRYSRALQTNTRYYIRVTCGAQRQEGSFDTTTIPLGVTYNDPLPVDPKKPGEYAWPSVDWINRQQKIIDPHTGLLIQRLTLPIDITNFGGTTPLRDGRDRSGQWLDPQAVAANDTRAASTTGTGWLFLDSGLNLFVGGTHDYSIASLDKLIVMLNAWCTDCANLSPDARALEACLSYDGVSCASKLLTAPVESCPSGDCTGARYRFEMGSHPPGVFNPIVTAWGLDKGDFTDLHRRTGEARRRGNRVFHVSGNVFNLNWNPGSVIVLNNRTLTISRVVNEKELVLEGQFDAGEESGSYIGSNFGILVRKKNSNAARIHIQFGSTTPFHGSPVDWDANGDGISHTQCAPVAVPGPSGEPGWHCLVGNLFYWIGSQTGETNRLGRPYLPNRTGVDGWGLNPGGAFCNANNGGGPFWDQDDPNSFYCGQIDSSGGVSVIKGTYRGANADIGPQDLYQTLLQCGPTQPEPCWVFENITPVSRGRSLNQQMRNRLPEFDVLRGTVTNMVGFKGKRILLMARSSAASNDALGVMGVFDQRTGSVIGAVASWKHWPLRWSVLHGPEPTDDPDWVVIPATNFRGPMSGDDFLTGHGPYLTRITSGAWTATPSACPPRPANSPIPPNEWPTGAQCAEVTVDGEPGDPSPAVHRAGTISSNDAGILSGNGTGWNPSFNRSQMLIDSRWYTFEYTSPTAGRITPAPPAPFTNASYAMYLEPVNNPKIGNPLHAYLQDAEVRDVFCVTADGNCRLLFQTNEFVRLIRKDGNRWTLQRAYRAVTEGADPQIFHPVPGNARLLAMPASCNLGPVYPCSSASVLWNPGRDPEGRNQDGNTVVIDRNSKGEGHGTIGAGAIINAVTQLCPRRDGQDLTCYSVRLGETFAERFSAETFLLSNNPPFEGRIGVGTPNDVDSHPSARQDREAATPEDRGWFGDGRPLLGSSQATGSINDPGVEIEDGLWKFKASQVRRLRPKYMPTIASCGSNPLLDVSGPSSRIDAPAAGGGYTYCRSLKSGECREGSEPGDLYVSCRFISRPYCHFVGVGVAGTDTRDICVMDNGGYTSGLTQIRHTEPDLDGGTGRLLTHGLSLYRWNDLFWNPKSTPDGRWMMFRTQWVNGKRAEAFLAKLPPMTPIDDQKRNGYLMQEINVPEGRDGVAVEFGYNRAFECTSRRESCVVGAGGGEPFYYSASESWKPVPCKNGCTVRIPAIPQRVVFYRLRYFDAGGKPAGETAASVVAVP